METPATYGHYPRSRFEPGDQPLEFDGSARAPRRATHLAAPFRRRLVTVPLGLDHPYWIEDPDFDLDYNLRHIGSSTGRRASAADLAAELAGQASRPAPPAVGDVRDRGSPAARAEVTKIHHAY
jgi:hypothetical protein